MKKVKEEVDEVTVKVEISEPVGLKKNLQTEENVTEKIHQMQSIKKTQ